MRRSRQQTKPCERLTWWTLVFCAALLSGMCFVFQVRVLWAGIGEIRDICPPLSTLLAGLMRLLPLGSLADSAAAQHMGGPLLVAALLFIAMLLCGRALMRRPGWAETLWKRRWLIGGVVCVCAVLLRLNGTSLAMWTVYLGGEPMGLLWGLPRAVRGDEYAVWSAMTLAQDAAGYPAVSPMIGGGSDAAWISMGGLPAWNLAAIFKPLYWGFLLLRAEHGFSLLWTLRGLLLFGVSLELALVYTRGNRPLSAAAAMLLTFAPYVQWFFSQSVAEVLIFSQGMVLCMQRFLQASRPRTRWGWAALGAYAIGCLAMVAYPTWIISVLYLAIPVMLLMGWRARRTLTRMDALRLLAPLCVVVALLGLIVLNSWDTISRVMASAYPGGRLYTGGYVPPTYGTGLYALLFQLHAAPVGSASELAGFLTFAPAGLVLCGYQAIRKRRLDALDAILLAVEAFFGAFLLFRFPDFLAQVTLLSQVTRAELVLGVADAVLLMRALSRSEGFRRPAAALLAAASTAVCMTPILRLFAPHPLIAAGLAALYLVVFLLIYACRRGTYRRLGAVLCAVAVLCGGFVNPVQQGVSCAQDSGLVRTLVELDVPEGAVFLTEAAYPLTNVPLLAGRACANATQVYADPARWQAVDPTGEYLLCYNRFCHFDTQLTDENTTFTLLQNDHVLLSLSYGDLPALDVAYVVTPNWYPAEPVPGVTFALTATVDGWQIYAVTYAEP